jgi:hypothetical protein
VQFLINTLISAVLIGLAVELSKRSTMLSALIISLPLTSIIALSLVYLRTGDTFKVINLSHNIFWLVLPSLGLFLVLPLHLKYGLNFWISLTLSCAGLAVFYLIYAWALRKFGIFVS